MMNNMMNGLMLLNAKTVDTASALKIHTKVQSKSEDSFAGIFQDKMNEASHSTQKVKIRSSERPLERASSAQPKDNETESGMKIKHRPESKETPVVRTESKSESGKTEAVKTDDDRVKDQKKTDGNQAMDVLNMLASLLEELYAQLEQVTEASEGETSETLTDEMTVSGSESANPFQVLKLKLMGRMDELKKILDSLKTESTNTSADELLVNLKSLLEQVEAITAKTTEAADGMNIKLNIKLINQDDEGRQAMMLKLKANGQDILGKLRIKLTEMVKNTSAATQTSNTVQVPSLTEEMGAQTASEDAQPEQTLVEAKDEGKQETNKEAVKLDVQPQTTTVKEEGSQEQVIQTNTMKVDNKVEVKAAKTEFHLSEKPLREAVTNQVMLKVKLMAGENKQEMEMHLKPESLGKLTLKIIHERGEILAKITAENQQVKSILESNMQLLKDSLEKSGFSVQNLSVSVGNGNQENSSQNQGAFQRRNRASETNVEATHTARGKLWMGSSLPQSLQTGESNIDLTA